MGAASVERGTLSVHILHDSWLPGATRLCRRANSEHVCSPALMLALGRDRVGHRAWKQGKNRHSCQPVGHGRTGISTTEGKAVCESMKQYRAERRNAKRRVGHFPLNPPGDRLDSHALWTSSSFARRVFIRSRRRS
jgi:hypothetical protein